MGGIFRLFCLLIFLTLGSLRLWAEDTTSSPPSFPNRLAISSISVEGTNLVLTVLLPSGIEQAILEISSELNGAWEEAGQLDVPANASEVTFTIPKPSEPMAFFRLKAIGKLETAPLLSPELQYVAVPSLASNLSENADALFHFKGFVDGSDKIVITRDGALWNHVNWDWPQGAVTINGTQWNPKEKNYVTTVGASKFLPDTFSLESVNLDVIQSRDVIALERATNALIVYLNDTPIGPGEYEFTIHFRPSSQNARSRAANTTQAHLKIVARIDGSDCLTITPTEATWGHKFHAWPNSVTLNDIKWNPKNHKILKNEGANTFLPAGVDLSTAKIVSRKGRDLATLWADSNALQIWFADNPNGTDSYELEISFGQ